MTNTDSMTMEEKVKHYAAGKITVGILQQFVGGDIKRYYVGKVRGVIVTTKNGFKFFTESAARENATTFRAKCRADLEEMQGK